MVKSIIICLCSDRDLSLLMKRLTDLNIGTVPLWYMEIDWQYS